ncbi:MAG: hypothetical protein AAF480_12350 [Actinomycetota bacterium]
MTKTSRWVLIVAAMVAAACGSSADGGATGSEPADEPAVEEVVAAEDAPTSTPTHATDAPTEEPAEEPEPAAAGTSSDEMPEIQFQEGLRSDFEYGFISPRGAIQDAFDAYAPLLLEPGTYTTDSMRTPMTFSLDQRWRLIVELPSYMLLVDHDRATGLWDLPLIQFNRPEAMIDPTDTTDGPPRLPRTVDGFDYDAWFEAHPQLEVERSEVAVGGIPSVRYLIAHPDGAEIGWPCRPGVQCTPLSMLWDAGPQDLQSDELFAFYVIPQGEGSPLTALSVVRADEGWGEFLAITEDLMASIEFGPVVEPVFSERPWEDGVGSSVPAGPLWFPVGPGFAFEVPQDLRADMRRNWSWLLLEDLDFQLFPPNVEIAMAVESPEGVPFETADQLADHLVERVAGAVRLADAELLGQRAARVQMFGVRPNELVFRHVDTPDDVDRNLAGWFTQDYVELWATETDEGVFILTAEAESEELLAPALELHEFVRDTLVIERR